MYVCLYVCMYVYICIYIYIHMYWSSTKDTGPNPAGFLPTHAEKVLGGRQTDNNNKTYNLVNRGFLFTNYVNYVMFV